MKVARHLDQPGFKTCSRSRHTDSQVMANTNRASDVAGVTMPVPAPSPPAPMSDSRGSRTERRGLTARLVDGLMHKIKGTPTLGSAVECGAGVDCH